MNGPTLGHSDWMSILGGAWAFVVLLGASLVGWIMRHSSRITRVEARQDASEKAASEDRQFIRSSLARIEDKLDRKQDKP